MAEYFSTQATIEARVSNSRLEGWIDFDDDGTVDPGTLEYGQKFARGEIRDKLLNWFGETEIATWDSDTVPESIGAISDDLCVWYFVSTNPALASQLQIAKLLFDDAVQRLNDIAEGKRGVYGVDKPITQSTTSRMQYLECTDEDAENGYCDPCAYEYI